MIQQAVANYTAEMRACAEAIDLRPPAIVQPEDRWVDLNGVRFHYVDWGNAHLPPLVLLHGGSLTAHTWDMSALLLRDRWHVIALDQRGHGDTGWTPDEQIGTDNSDLMLQDTAAFMEHLGMERVLLCGMSMGGMNAIRYTARHPERLAALVIVDIAPVTMQQGVIEMEQFRRETETMRRFEDFLDRAVKFNPQRRPAHLKYSLLHSLKPVADGWTWKQDHRRRPQMEGMSEEQMKAARDERARQMWADLDRIALPTLLMRGAISKILSPEAAREVLARMAGCEYVVVPRAGHSVQGDNPRDFARALDAFATRRLERRD
ncbi:MAG: alpha/beta hydrolase [Chloroflexi bacterium]|nr:alpha/beta hydrolase [Chloroflexota bacterium]